MFPLQTFSNTDFSNATEQLLRADPNATRMYASGQNLHSDQTGLIHTLAGSGLNSELCATHGVQLGSSGTAKNNTAIMNVQTNSKSPIALQNSSIQPDQGKEEVTQVAKKFQLKIPVGFMPFPDYIFTIGAMEGSQLLPHALNFLSNHYLGGPPPLPVVNGNNASLFDLYEMYSKKPSIHSPLPMIQLS
ncbi:hypothetical protein CAEBREN_21956 [Caenorhabditis brenneri]|uniref:Uncharacterized protein n=1 Tax=Caenorhabditis brenneri TaxID=135651 RepID=G0MMT0_CAEBE|nr:hypothetical protein CAEBREN_21956 [Caenorhabditis brenneri]